jgi:hypothetical protein
MYPLNLTAFEIRQRTWMKLERETRDRHHEWRTPVLAAVGKDGVPNNRTAVLLHADIRLQTRQFFTDSRIPKTIDLIHQLKAMIEWLSLEVPATVGQRLAPTRGSGNYRNDLTQAEMPVMRYKYAPACSGMF